MLFALFACLAMSLNGKKERLSDMEEFACRGEQQGPSLEVVRV